MPNDTFDMEKMMRMAQTFSQFYGGGLPNEEVERLSEEKVEKETLPQMRVSYELFDDELRSPKLKALKAAIPFMEPQTGKRLAIIIKMIEIKNIMTMFEQRVVSDTPENVRFERIIAAMRPHCDAETRRITEIAEKALEMGRLFESMNGKGNV